MQLQDVLSHCVIYSGGQINMDKISAVIRVLDLIKSVTGSQIRVKTYGFRLGIDVKEFVNQALSQGLDPKTPIE